MAPPGRLRGLALEEACLRQMVASGTVGRVLWAPPYQRAIVRALSARYGGTAAARAARRVGDQLVVRALRSVAAVFALYHEQGGEPLGVRFVLDAVEDLERVPLDSEAVHVVLEALVHTALHKVMAAGDIARACRSAMALVHFAEHPDEPERVADLRLRAIALIKKCARRGLRSGRKAMAVCAARYTETTSIEHCIRELRSYAQGLADNLGPLWYPTPRSAPDDALPTPPPPRRRSRAPPPDTEDLEEPAPPPSARRDRRRRTDPDESDSQTVGVAASARQPRRSGPQLQPVPPEMDVESDLDASDMDPEDPEDPAAAAQYRTPHATNDVQRVEDESDPELRGPRRTRQTAAAGPATTPRTPQRGAPAAAPAQRRGARALPKLAAARTPQRAGTLDWESDMESEDGADAGVNALQEPARDALRALDDASSSLRRARGADPLASAVAQARGLSRRRDLYRVASGARDASPIDDGDSGSDSDAGPRAPPRGPARTSLARLRLAGGGEDDDGSDTDYAPRAPFRIKTGKFSRGEDEMLKTGLAKHGWSEWQRIAESQWGGLPERRTKDSVKDRCRYLVRMARIDPADYPGPAFRPKRSGPPRRHTPRKGPAPPPPPGPTPDDDVDEADVDEADGDAAAAAASAAAAAASDGPSPSTPQKPAAPAAADETQDPDAPPAPPQGGPTPVKTEDIPADVSPLPGDGGAGAAGRGGGAAAAAAAAPEPNRLSPVVTRNRARWLATPSPTSPRRKRSRSEAVGTGAEPGADASGAGAAGAGAAGAGAAGAGSPRRTRRRVAPRKKLSAPPRSRRPRRGNA